MILNSKFTFYLTTEEKKKDATKKSSRKIPEEDAHRFGTLLLRDALHCMFSPSAHIVLYSAWLMFYTSFAFFNPLFWSPFCADVKDKLRE